MHIIIRESTQKSHCFSSIWNFNSRWSAHTISRKPKWNRELGKLSKKRQMPEELNENWIYDILRKTKEQMKNGKRRMEKNTRIRKIKVE